MCSIYEPRCITSLSTKVSLRWSSRIFRRVLYCGGLHYMSNMSFLNFVLFSWIQLMEICNEDIFYVFFLILSVDILSLYLLWAAGTMLYFGQYFWLITHANNLFKGGWWNHGKLTCMVHYSLFTSRFRFPLALPNMRCFPRLARLFYVGVSWFARLFLCMCACFPIISRALFRVCSPVVLMSL